MSNIFKENLDDSNKTNVGEDLTAYVIGQAFLSHMREAGVLKDILASVESEALRILEEIRRALDDETLDDPECFLRIEKILAVMEAHYIGSSRHDF